MKKGTKTIVAAIILSICAVLLASCGLQEPEDPAASAEITPASVESGSASAPPAPVSAAPSVTKTSNKTIGTPSDSSTVTKVSLMNLTGQDITGFAVKHSFEKEFGANMLAAGETFVLDEVRDLFYDLAPSIEAGKNSTEALTYEVQVTLADGSSYILHQFPFQEFEQGRIILQDELLFLEYVSPYTGEDLVTRKDEAAIQKKAAEKAAEEQLAAQQAAEQQWAAEQAAQQQWAEQQWAAQQAAEQQWAAEQAAQQQWAAQQQQQNQGAGCVGSGALVY